MNGESTYPFYLFANPVFKGESYPENCIILEAGKLHRTGKIELTGGQTLIIEEGAVVKGYIVAKNAENIRILGRGILDGSDYGKANMPYPNRMIQLDNCRDVTIDGPIIFNSSTWTVEPTFCRDVRINNLKMLNWRFGSDGIDIVGCRNITIDHSFIRANDDCVVIKTWGGKEKYPTTPEKGVNASNIKVLNSVFWKYPFGELHLAI